MSILQLCVTAGAIVVVLYLAWLAIRLLFALARVVLGWIAAILILVAAAIVFVVELLS